MAVPRLDQFINDFLSTGYVLAEPEQFGYERAFPIDYVIVLKITMSQSGKMSNGTPVGRLAYDADRDNIWYGKIFHEGHHGLDYCTQQAKEIFDVRAHMLETTCS